MILTTQDSLKEYVITETLGLVKGNAIRARHIGKDILATFRNIVGGELTEYTKLLAETREQSLDRMIADAEAKGAEAIVGVRFTTSAVTQGAAELFAYGTAVKITKRVS